MNDFSIKILNLMENWSKYNSIVGNHIVTKFCTLKEAIYAHLGDNNSNQYVMTETII